jgi:DNA-binding NtrC family response regulator
MQGYLFNHPLQPDAVAKLLAENVRLRLGAHTSTYVQTLLVVDDETSILSAMSRVFRHEHYRVLVAQTAAEAFDLLARNTVQVIISDQRMATMSGTEFFARVRQLYPDTLRIILTGYTELEAVMDAVNRGAVYKFLTKPWEDDQLREHVREAFRVSASKDAP